MQNSNLFEQDLKEINHLTFYSDYIIDMISKKVYCNKNYDYVGQIDYADNVDLMSNFEFKILLSNGETMYYKPCQR
jgi:hypothetical protein